MAPSSRERSLTALLALCGAALLGLLAGSCARGADPGDGPSEGPIYPLTERFFPGGVRPVEVGPVPRGLSGVDAEDCVECHADIVAEWREDAHSRSYTNRFFQAGFRIDRYEFCRHCHAPRAQTGIEPVGAAREDGIDCATCHIRDGKVISTRLTRAGQEAHDEQALPLMGESGFCGDCHQFRFPDVPLIERVAFDPAMYMQKTLDEWRASRFGREGVGCVECHMPLTADQEGGGRHRSHRFLGLSDLDFVRGAVAVEVEAARRSSYVSVRVRIDPAGVGHSFPTGDVLRQLRLEVVPEGAPALAKSLDLGRRFAPVAVFDDRVVLRREVLDRRVAPPGSGGGQELPYVFLFPGLETPAKLSYRLEVLRCADRMAHLQGLRLEETHLTIHEGAVRVP